MTYQERELNLIKEMQEGSESDEQEDSFLRSHGEEDQIRESSGLIEDTKQQSPKPLLRRMDGIREKPPALNRDHSPPLEGPGTGSSVGPSTTAPIS